MPTSSSAMGTLATSQPSSAKHQPSESSSKNQAGELSLSNKLSPSKKLSFSNLAGTYTISPTTSTVTNPVLVRAVVSGALLLLLLAWSALLFSVSDTALTTRYCHGCHGNRFYRGCVFVGY